MTKRAGNGDGSIRSRTTKTRGVVWDVQMTVRDSQGLSTRHGKRGFATQKAAQDWRDSEKRLIKLGKTTKAPALRVSDLYGKYIQAHPGLAPSTLRGYESVMRLHIKTRLDLQVQQITKARVQEWVYETQEILEDKGRTGSGTVKQGLAVLRAVLRWASGPDVRLIGSNPLDQMDIKDPTTARKGRAFTKKELRRLFEHSQPGSVILWRLLFETATRKGEILAIDWEDLHLKRGEIVIDRIASPESNYRVVVRRTKGKKDRTVPLSKAVVALLRARKKELGASATGPLFVAPRGGRAFGSTVADWWERDTRAAGLEDLTIHELRHTWASTALRKGADIKVVSEMLGHANLATTAVYLHTTKGAKRSAVELVSGSL